MSNTKTILVVEDEPKIRQGLVDFLQFQGFEVNFAVDGLEAERAVNDNRFDMILLDLMLPMISGEQLCTKWRQAGIQTPIIMLTAKGLESERISGLNLGADDYITKPFSLEELLARINSVLRRTDPAKAVGSMFAFGNGRVDVGALKFHTNNENIAITSREAEMLRLFAANPGRIISRQQLYERIWGESMDEIETRTVDVHIGKLRSKIETGGADVIKTVRGAGYVYEPGDECDGV